MHEAKAVKSRSDESAGGAASRPASKAFQFVTALPSSEAERSQNKILVRSNASNFHWRRVKKDKRSESLSPGRPAATRRRSTSSISKSRSRALAPATPNKNDSTSPESDNTSPPKTEDERSEQAFTDSPAHSDVVILPDSALSTLLPSTHHDPFGTYPSDLPTEFVSRVLDQVKNFLGLMFPPGGGQTIHPLATTWLQMTFRDRGLFHASLFCQLTRNRIFYPSPVFLESRETMQCYTETIRGVHQKFKDNSMSCEDENILSVYSLTYHGDLRPHQPAIAPSQGPLTTLQLLHVYGGRLETVQVHLQGLAKMLTLRGGLSKIKLPGLAQAISFGDIVLACQTLSPPMLPYVMMHDDVVSLLNSASRKTHPLVGLGKGFRVLPEMLGHAHEDVSKLLVVLKWMIQYTFAVDDHVQERPESQTQRALMDQRNFVQHNLMQLMPDALALVEEHPMCRLTRLGTVVYSFLVVFPLPAIAAPFGRLSSDIIKQLSLPDVQDCWNEAADLMLWVTVMGAIASIGTPDRPWYLTTLDRLSRELDINSWHSMREKLKLFLWFEYTNDSDGMKLWRDIEESSVSRVSQGTAEMDFIKD